MGIHAQSAEILGSQGHYLQTGVVQISLANLLIIVFMILLFLLALVLPFPGADQKPRAAKDVRH